MNTKTKIFLIFFLVLFGITSRFLPHAWNFTPVVAIIMFASAYFGMRYSFFALFGIMFVSDFFLGFYDWQIMLAVYGSFALVGMVGLFLKEKRTLGLIFSGSLLSSFIFFAVTNWAVWQFGTMYPHTIGGLLESYTMAIPFFRNSVLGDIFYSGVLFGSYEMFTYYVTNKRKVEKFAA